MPRPPDIAPSVAAVGGSVFSKLAGRIAAHEGEVYALHVGDTWMAPPVRPSDLAIDLGQHRYASPRGLPAMVDRIADRLTHRHGVPTTSANVAVTSGATGGLAVACGALLAPGDEVLILAPYWPLIAGIVRTQRGVPVPVDVLDAPAPTELVARLDAAAGARAVAVYVATPNNPTGRAVSAEAMSAIAGWARSRGLWILADEVYEDHQHVGTHVPMRSLAPERTVSVHSVSKAFGLAGHRLGYLAAPEGVMAAVQKVIVHSFYSVSKVSQGLAYEALGPLGEAWLQQARAAYVQAGRAAADALGVPHPDGSTFLFVDVEAALDHTGLLGFLERAADRGLFLSPGSSFGPYPNHVRVCFTAAPPDVTARGVAVLAELLDS